ncbi:GNAT family N-acetyltransferase [Kroppenstedtia eburnea]|uniref:GNAT family N-acetyltransferase n=1 Tax=Kroppenstedtia eburnea TaxID=714067 RepID=UPI00363961AF
MTANWGTMVESILIGERVRLTALEEKDLATVATWSRDDHFMRRLDAEASVPRTESQLKKWLAEHHESDKGFLFALRPPEGEELIGFIEIDGILWNHRTGWISIGIGSPEHRGRGWGREAMSLALRFAFQELNLHRLQLTVISYNTDAIRLYERLGFTREGTYREFLEREGQRWDMLLYGLLRREWNHR